MTFIFPYKNHEEIVERGDKHFKYGILWTICEDVIKNWGSNDGNYKFMDWFLTSDSILNYNLNVIINDELEKQVNERDSKFNQFISSIEQIIGNIHKTNENVIKQLTELVYTILVHPKDYNSDLVDIIKSAANQTLYVFSSRLWTENRIQKSEVNGLMDNYYSTHQLN